MPILLTAPAATVTVADRVCWTAAGRPRAARAVTARLGVADTAPGAAWRHHATPAGPDAQVPVRTVAPGARARRHRRTEPLTLPERGLRQVQAWATRHAA